MGISLRGGHWFEILPKLAKEYRVIVPDNRGTGRSDTPEMPYTAKMMAGDVAGLLDVLGIEKATVFGYSLGGMVAQEFALNYPDRLNNLILGATFCGGKRAVPLTPEAIAFLFDPELAKLPVEDRARATIPWMWCKEAAENNPSIEQFIATSCEYPTTTSGFKNQTSVGVTLDTYDRLPDIKVPALVITGTEDRIMPYENSKLLASRIPGAELVMIDNAAHGVFIGDPTDKVSKIVLDFLHRHSKARAKN
jgi:pimeloyl-ACP methyl ester carboxylesterase